MPEHATPGEPTLVNAEPASTTELARLIVAALVALGVFEFEDTVWNAITLALGGLISIALTWYTRRKSTALAKPRTEDGRPLVPAPGTRLANPARGA